jgi:hypothetical protein
MISLHIVRYADVARIHAKIVSLCHFVVLECILARQLGISLLLYILYLSVDRSVERESEKTTVGVGSVSYNMSRLL